MPGDQNNARTSSITDMAFVDGRLYVAGLSNEEFSSKLRSVGYPFNTVDNGASVEIYHGNHGQFETRSPVYTFVPYKVKGETNLIAGYLCTPLVKFPVNSLKSGAKVMGTTIAELGNRNRPLDMIVYQEGRQGVPADVEQQPRRDEDPDRELRRRRRASPRASPTEKGGIGYESDHVDEGRGAARPARRATTPSSWRARTPASSTSTSSRCRKSHVHDAEPQERGHLLAALFFFAALRRAAAARRRRQRHPARDRAQRRDCPRPTIDVVDVPRGRAARARAHRIARGVDGGPRVSVARRSAGDARRSIRSRTDGIRFTPMFPLDPGRAVSRDASRRPARRRRVDRRRVGLPAPDTTPTTVVAQVYPTADVVPENQLRLYIHFSAPMGMQRRARLRHLLDDAGARSSDPFLPLDAEFWNDDRTRYTVFFDPGRQKRGIAPIAEMGRSLDGRASRYTLVVDAEWRDGNGLPLKQAFRREFKVGPPDERRSIRKTLED